MSSKKHSIVGKLERQKRRATELYDADSPFRQKIVERKDGYQRKPKYKNSFFNQQGDE